MKTQTAHRLATFGAISTAIAALLAACSSTPLPAQKADTPTAAPAQAAIDAAAGEPPNTPDFVASHTARPSQAPNPKAYRADAAAHLYALNKDRIYKGRMPPLLYAIGVLQVEVGRNGDVEKVNWMRAPNHAPEVVKEIERTVRAAAPFPVPARMGRVVYTDTWLWHKSGRFQLDTLTEGQD
ncbi:hypothetical protein [Caenimonas koreensis]|uniref:Protein TonB n=1 Tax=Caenimonas koreensis DSM 17982 TaxID=1121255 RepID=A0A844B6C4_9BURK|nr:hypothetical protein [Caenimonas koreensis]MRD46101.1 hypothetical protein [Caenimonas koreensis DSM 17982]